ncbi:MAG: oligoendopeptidase F [Lachnospiraceae bacterium]|nr:oligoendopeptidase F [Lachnospiraceae bacterium]
MEQKLPKRSEVSEELTWRLEDIYATEADWEADLEKGRALGEQIASYEGRAAESAKNLLEVLRIYEEGSRILSSVYTYANCRHDEDTAAPKGQELVARAQRMAAQMMEKSAFLDPEILAIPDETLAAYYEEEPALKDYEVTIRNIVRMRAHALPVEGEKLLAFAMELMEAPSNSFGMLVNADLKFPSVTDKDGKEVQISNGRFVPLQESGDRDLREKVFKAFYGRYKEFSNTWAAMYAGEVKGRSFSSRARGYKSSFEAAVDRNDVSPSVCDNLFDSVHRHLDAMHRYVRLRKKLLGVDELHMWDVYTPIVKDYEVKVPYAEACDIIVEALAPMGEEYVSVVKEAIANRWIDVVENEGKRGGAYSTGVYGVHPYMLLNYNETLDNVFTLIHEMGHSMHTWYSCKNQSVLNAEYKIFVAEVASTTNEVLLLEYLLKKASSREEKAYLINHYLESFKSTVYRQTMFEEFERKTCAMEEAGTPLTAQLLAQTYHDLNKQYFGDAMISDDLIAYEWCRIPHFYYNFYVYQYATSFCAAVAIAHRILEEGAPMVEQYKKFLSGGCTQDPVSLLKIAGVDMSTSAPMDEALEVFAQAIGQMEELSAE